MEIKESIIASAEEWAESVWREADSQWTVRSGQDKNYRWYVINPAIITILNKLSKKRNLRILDLGCGDGFILEDQKFREYITGKGVYTGVDISSELLAEARRRYTGDSIRFREGDLGDNDLARKLHECGNKWDVVISVFVVQEIPDITSFFANFASLLSPESLGIIITVHPGFAAWLKESGRLRIAEQLTNPSDSENTLWQWAGYYPIVDDMHGVFFLPHFQRTMGDYQTLFMRYGMTVETVLEIPDRVRELPDLVHQNISPFTNYEKNVYWPHIAEEPSSVVFIFRKGTTGGNH